MKITEIKTPAGFTNIFPYSIRGVARLYFSQNIKGFNFIRNIVHISRDTIDSDEIETAKENEKIIKNYFNNK